MRLSTTREVINKFLPYVEGRVLDLGAGSAKYKEMILQKASEYNDFTKSFGVSLLRCCKKYKH